MKDSLKIALGIFLGVLAVIGFAVCVAAGMTAGGIALIEPLISPEDKAPTPTHRFLPSLPTTTPPLGNLTECDQLGLALVSYALSDTCPSGVGSPTEGALFVIVRIRAANFTSDVLPVPNILFRLDEYEPSLGSTGDCTYDNQAFGNACWQWGGRLFPDVECEGWELFEVPIAFDASAAILHASFTDDMTRISCDARWPLDPPSR